MSWGGRMDGLDEWYPNSRPRVPRCFGVLREAAPEQVGDHILKLAILLYRADLDLPHEIIWKVKCGLHENQNTSKMDYQHYGRPMAR